MIKLFVPDIKLYTFNSIALITPMTTILEVVLKVSLLIVTLGYTVQKWYFMNKENKKNKADGKKNSSLDS